MFRTGLIAALLLSIWSVAVALPQGTYTWTFEDPGVNNTHFAPGWTWDTANMTAGQYPPNGTTPRYYSPTWSGYFVNRQGYIMTEQLYFAAGEYLNFSAWLYNAGVGTVDVRIYASTSPSGPWNSGTQFYNAQNVNVNSGWTKVGGTYNATSSGSYYIRYAVVCNSGNAQGYIDDITVTYNLGAALNVNSTGYLQPGTTINKNGSPTGFNTNYSFYATTTTLGTIAGTYTPGTPPTGYHWVNPSIVVNTSDFTQANNYVHTITFILEKDFTLHVTSTGYNQPGTIIYKDGSPTPIGQTNTTFTATTAAALAGSYTPGPAPEGYYWETTPIEVLASGFTAGNDYTQTITFVLKKYFTLIISSFGIDQPGTTIYKNGSDTGFTTPHTFYATTAAGLAGSYTPGPAPEGYYWVSSPIVVTEGDFTEGNSYTYSGTFTLTDEPLPVELSSFNAAISVQNTVDLIWITQTETNVSGFRIYRNAAPNLENAVMLNTFVSGTNTSQTQVYFYRDEEINAAGIYYYWLQSLDFDGANQFHGPVSVTIQQYQATPPPVEAVQGIDQVFPNPFNPSVNIHYSVTKSGRVSLDVFDIRGRHVTTLFSGNREPGLHKLVWLGTDSNGNNLGSGIYTIRMSADGKTYNRKVMLLK